MKHNIRFFKGIVFISFGLNSDKKTTATNIYWTRAELSTFLLPKVRIVRYFDLLHRINAYHLKYLFGSIHIWFFLMVGSGPFQTAGFENIWPRSYRPSQQLYAWHQTHEKLSRWWYLLVKRICKVPCTGWGNNWVVITKLADLQCIKRSL